MWTRRPLGAHFHTRDCVSSCVSRNVEDRKSAIPERGSTGNPDQDGQNGCSGQQAGTSHAQTHLSGATAGSGRGHRGQTWESKGGVGNNGVRKCGSGGQAEAACGPSPRWAGEARPCWGPSQPPGSVSHFGGPLPSCQRTLGGQGHVPANQHGCSPRPTSRSQGSAGAAM